MRRFLFLSTVVLLAACGGEHQGTHDEEDSGFAVDPGDKPGKWFGPGEPRDASDEDEGSVDGSPHEEPMGARDSGPGTQIDSGQDPEEPQPKDLFEGTFEVTTTYKRWGNGCVPTPVTTTANITKLDAAEYQVLPSKATRFVVRESWFVVDASTLASATIDEILFTATGFTGTYTFNGSLGLEPGASGNCSYSGFTLQGVRK